MAPGLRRLIGAALPGGEEDGRRLLVWLAGSHDVGKATPAFAVQVGSLQNVMAEAGLTVTSTVLTDRSKLRHEVAGAAILEGWLEERFDIGPRSSRQLTDVVAGHHGAYASERAVIEAHEAGALIGGGLWTEVQRFLAERSARRAGVVERLPDWRRVRLSPAVQMELTAIVVMADWIASSADYFPLLTVRDVPPVPDADIALNRQRVDRAWRRLNLAARWDPEVPTGAPGVVFADRFPATRGQPRPVQEAAARLARTMNADGLMIIEAAMGEGKTEAALLAAEVLAARAGRSGCFVALPTQATSNAMFSRVLRWMERLPTAPDGGLDHQSVSLVHGKAALNDEFTNLRFGGHVVGISGEDRDGPEWDSPAEHGATRRLRATVHEWMTGRKRAALSSFVVGTIDQVLFGSLVARHVMLRQLSLASKVVVIDEVHMPAGMSLEPRVT